MRLAVFGPTGKTGQHVVQQALGRGYAVYAVARRPESVPARHKNLTVIGGDVLSPDGWWASQLAGVDAIISALGGRDAARADHDLFRGHLRCRQRDDPERH